MAITAFMGMDLGSSGARVGVYAADGTPLSKAEVPYPTVYPQPGRAEQSPAHWWQALCAASRQALARLREPCDIRTVTVGATSSTVLMVDARNEPLGNALLWMDSRAVDEAAAFNATAHPYLKYCGGEVSVEWMGPKSLWLKKHSPLFPRAVRVVEMLDYVNFRLSGRWVASQCNATCKWNYVDKLGGFAPDLFAAAGFDRLDLWPQEVLPMGAPIGRLTPQAATALGLSSRPELLQGGIDAHVGMFGLGVVEPGRIAVIMGTSFVHLALTQVEVFTPGLWGPYPNAVMPGCNLLEGGQISAGANVRWFRDTLARDRGQEAYAALSAEASAIPPGSDGVLALDFWQGSRTPLKDPVLQGALLGLKLHHAQAHLFRAILESVAYGCRHVLDAFAAASGGERADSLAVCGGPTRNPLWMQIIADVCQTRMRIPEDADGGLLGGAVLGAMHTGEYASAAEATAAMVRLRAVLEPEPAAMAAYEPHYALYKAAITALTPVMHANAALGRRQPGRDA